MERPDRANRTRGVLGGPEAGRGAREPLIEAPRGRIPMPPPIVQAFAGRDWRQLVARHLFGYLAVLAAVVVVISAMLAREELALAASDFDLRWLPPVLGLSLFNYGLRFLKWHRLLSDVGVHVPFAGNARLYFACLAMVVTPARLGELYKVVFLRRLHGVPADRSLPPLILERVTDALAVLALVAARPFEGFGRLAGVLGSLLILLVVGWGLAHPRWRRILLALARRIPALRRRSARVETLVVDHAQLLRPRSLGPNLLLSTAAWWAECLGLYTICLGLSSTIAPGQATWIYALSTLLGNLTFLPGGLGGTEVSLVALLRTVGVEGDASIAATALVRAATLWFAVAVGLIVTAIFRRRLQWDEVTEEAARASVEERVPDPEGDPGGRRPPSA